MEYQKEGESYIVRLEKGEEIFSAFYELAKKENISTAQISGIGAVENVEIGSFYRDEKSYKRKTLKEVYELISMDGNITLLDGKPFVHLHAVLGDHDYQCIAGHLFSAEVAVTLEAFIRPMDIRVHRSMNESIGLSLMDLK